MEVQETENVVEFKQRFDNFVNEFLSKSQNNCIVTREKATRILRILKGDPSVDDPQLKFYVKQKQFQLRDFPQLKLRNVLCVPTTSSSRKNHSSKANQGMFGKYHRVALKDEFFSTIYEIHTQEGSSKHLGYKSSVQEINRHHAHIPRALILDFIKMCPLCSQCPDDLNLLSAGDLSQSSNESNDNPFPEHSFMDIKPNIQILSKAAAHNHFANGVLEDEPSTYSSSSQPFVTPPQYSPAPPPSATQWGNSQETIDASDQEIIEANHFMAVGKVSIIDIQEFLNLSSPPRHYTCLVHYIDIWSKYSVLWPLRMRDMDELAFGIAKNVFAYFGSPKQIIYDTNFDEAQQLEESLRKWSKQVKVTVGLQEPLASSGPVHWKIMDKLKELLVESWEVKLSKLQYISNTKLVTTHEHISPYKAVTGNDPMTEAFSDLADKYNVHPDTLQPDFMLTQICDNVPSETNSSPAPKLSGYSLYQDPAPIMSNVCHINLSDDSPIITSSAPPNQQMEPVCTMDIVCNSMDDMSKQLETCPMERRLSHHSGSVTSPPVSVNRYPSPESPVTSNDVHSPDIVSDHADDDDDDDDDMIYIDDDDDADIDTKDIVLIEDFNSTVEPSVTENQPMEHHVVNHGTKTLALIEDFNATVQPSIPENHTTDYHVETNGTTNMALLEDFSSSIQPSTSQNFPPEPNIDTKTILLVGGFNSTEQSSISDNSAGVETDDFDLYSDGCPTKVSELDKIPRLAQSFSFPSTFDNKEEAETSPNPTDLEISMATSLSDCHQPFLTKSAQNVIDKYKLRAKIQNTAQMKANRSEEKPSHSKRKVHQEPLHCSLEISEVTNRQPKQRMLYAITSAGGSGHRIKSRSGSAMSEMMEKRKEYWRRMKQRARARMSDEEKEMLNQRRRLKYAQRKRSFFGGP